MADGERWPALSGDWAESPVDERLATGRLTVDLEALRDNWKKLAALAPDAATGAAVKAEAYGLGLEPVAGALAEAGCRHFFVANPHEGIRLRANGAGSDSEIFVLAGLTRDAAPFYHEAHLTPILNSPAEIGLWADWCRQSGLRRPCGVHVDTGLNRLGLRLTETAAFARENSESHDVTVVLLMSHLACADDPGNPMNGRQLDAFTRIAAQFPGTRLSLSNSAGIMLGADFHQQVTRPGIALYGGEAARKGENPMRPVVTLEGRILQIRRAGKGETVGYGASASLERDSRIAIAGVGYGDGVFRAASGSGVPMRQLTPGAKGWLAGHEIPVLGRISMDLTAFDVTDIPQSVLEDAEWIEIFGPNRPLDDFARAAGTIGYEVLTGLGRRVTRRYVGWAD